ncbi:MAG TPA: T9SS type A sorting domain-containing protein, partial [Brumimicrobium sp.]|nr:T9SS type A sorting domain-containing protein [Brumimicrobium sp.]
SGTDGSVEVCRLDGSVDLTDGIIAHSIENGRWAYPANQALIQDDTMFAIGTLPAGAHEVLYIVDGLCNNSSDTTIALVNVFNESSAGNGLSITVCKNEPINLFSALSGNVDLGGDWYDYNNDLLPNSQPTSPSLAAQYNYNYITSNGVCPADTAVVEVNVDNCVWVSVDEELFTDISVYPNPATSLLNIVNPSNTASLKVEMLDMNGRVVLIENKALNNASEATIAIDHLERGFYTLRVYNNEGQRTFKIVKL